MKSKWLVLFLIWLMMLVAYFDRIDIAVAGPAIMKELHFSKAAFGFVVSAFTLGYAVMQAPGGHFADRFGPRRLLIVAIFLWSIFTSLTGMAATLVSMIVIRIVFGVGEGLENGAQFKLIGDYFTPIERSRANALFLSALAIGPALCTPIAAAIVANYDWRILFYSFAVLGVVVGAILWMFLPRDGAHTPAHQEPGEGVSFWKALRETPCMLSAAGYFLFNMAFWGFLSWVPTYLNQERHIAIKDIGFLGSVPYLAGFVGMLLIGNLGSSHFSSKRPLILLVCFLGSAAGLYYALGAPNQIMCIVGLSICAFFLYSIFGPFWAIAVDLAPAKSRGVFTGSVNCCGQIGAFISQIAIGQLADKMHSFTGAILFMVAALVIGGLTMIALQRSIGSSKAVLA